MNYTENYHLPQWVKSDRIMMEDFNQMCADLESGLTDAKATADTARSEAAELPYVVGNYTGSGTPQEITLGFRPRFVLICSGQAFSNAAYVGSYTLMAGPNTSSGRAIFTDTGFQVLNDSHNLYPEINITGRNYDYIAFR